MKLFGRSKSRITKDKNGENVPHLEMDEKGLVHCNIVSNDYQQDSRVLHTFVPNKSLGQVRCFTPQILYFWTLLFQNFDILKYGLLIKLLNHWR